MYRHYKKLYPKVKLDIISASNQINVNGNGVSLKEDDLELKEKTERPVFLSPPVLLSEVDEPPIEQTSFCEYKVTVHVMCFDPSDYSGIY